MNPVRFVKTHFNPCPPTQDKAGKEIAERNLSNCIILTGIIALAILGYPNNTKHAQNVVKGLYQDIRGIKA